MLFDAWPVLHNAWPMPSHAQPIPVARRSDVRHNQPGKFYKPAPVFFFLISTRCPSFDVFFNRRQTDYPTSTPFLLIPIGFTELILQGGRGRTDNLTTDFPKDMFISPHRFPVSEGLPTALNETIPLAPSYFTR